MAGGHLNKLLSVSSSASALKPSRPFFYNPTKKYWQASNKGQERAPSTAEEFERVAQEKAKAQQGIANQTTDKTSDGTEEATMGESKVDSEKKRYKNHETDADYRRRGD